MKNFASIDFDPPTCRQQLAEFKQLLESRQALSERDDILPFFRQREQLAAFIGCCQTKIVKPNRFAFEYDIFGDFSSDLVIGDTVKQAYCFVEFEEAASNSIFVTKTNRSMPEWAPRFERGCSQIIDWFWKLGDLERTEDFENRFGGRRIDYTGLLIIGRSQYLEPREKKRLEWRQEKLIINSKQIYCMTFDELYEDLSFRIDQYPWELDR